MRKVTEFSNCRNFFRRWHEFLLGLIGVPELFSFNFLCANIFFVLRPSPHKFSNGPSLIVHRSASDNLAVVHSSCLFGAESYSGQRERKSVWQGFQSKICELVSSKLSKCLDIHSYTHQLYLRLTSVFWSTTFKTTAPRNVTDNT